MSVYLQFPPGTNPGGNEYIGPFDTIAIAQSWQSKWIPNNKLSIVVEGIGKQDCLSPEQAQAVLDIQL